MILWLRDETKPLERRTPLTPHQAKTLVDAGVSLTVESSELRVFPDSAYRAAGASVVGSGSWRDAPDEAVILGLKELPDGDEPLRHRHIFFAHVYKGQPGADAMLRRFRDGGGRIFDLEYLVDQDGRRIAAFGYWAGYMGAALGVALVGHQAKSPQAPFPAVTPFDYQDAAAAWAQDHLPASDSAHRAIIIGALGRTGAGASDLLERVGFEVTKWDLAETKAGGPFPEILEHDLFVNCVLMTQKTPPFLTLDMLRGERKLTAIADVACDPGGPVNPLPIYDTATSMTEPALSLDVGEPPLAITAIDYLPSLLPKESSEDFATQLFPHLHAFATGEELPAVFARAGGTFDGAVAALSD